MNIGTLFRAFKQNLFELMTCDIQEPQLNFSKSTLSAGKTISINDCKNSRILSITIRTSPISFLDNLLLCENEMTIKMDHDRDVSVPYITIEFGNNSNSINLHQDKVDIQSLIKVVDNTNENIESINNLFSYCNNLINEIIITNLEYIEKLNKE